MTEVLGSRVYENMKIFHLTPSVNTILVLITAVIIMHFGFTNIKFVYFIGIRVLYDNNEERRSAKGTIIILLHSKMERCEKLNTAWITEIWANNIPRTLQCWTYLLLEPHLQRIHKGVVLLSNRESIEINVQPSSQPPKPKTLLNCSKRVLLCRTLLIRDPARDQFLESDSFLNSRSNRMHNASQNLLEDYVMSAR